MDAMWIIVLDNYDYGPVIAGVFSDKAVAEAYELLLDHLTGSDVIALCIEIEPDKFGPYSRLVCGEDYLDMFAYSERKDRIRDFITAFPAWITKEAEKIMAGASDVSAIEKPGAEMSYKERNAVRDRSRAKREALRERAISECCHD